MWQFWCFFPRLLPTAMWIGGIRNLTQTRNSHYIRIFPEADVRILNFYSTLLSSVQDKEYSRAQEKMISTLFLFNLHLKSYFFFSCWSQVVAPSSKEGNIFEQELQRCVIIAWHFHTL